MSDASAGPMFRLLDARVGWDPRTPDGVTGLTGLDDPAGIRLVRVDGTAGPTGRDLLPWFAGPRLAPGCGPCSWYLLGPGGRLRHRRACSAGWPLLRRIRDARVVAARGHLLAVADGHRIQVWRSDGGQLIAVIPGPAGALGFTGWGELLVARPGHATLDRYDLAGDHRGRRHTGVPAPVTGLTVGRDWSIWLVSTGPGGHPTLWRGERTGDPFRPADLADLAAAVPASTLIDADDLGFCLTEPGPEGTPVRTCLTWEGQPLPDAVPAPPALVPDGELLTTALDSGIRRCRWHRVRLDADVPTGTALVAAVATGDRPDQPPADDDWQDATPGVRDFLVQQPPGRYLFVRLRLHGDGVATPVVRQVVLDFPRITSADRLPAVYRQDPAADDFTERFLSLFDASLATVDRVVERYPALLDGQGVPDDLLPWLGGFLGLVFDPAWDAATRRALLLAAPELYRRRGTAWALAETTRIVFGTLPVIVELAAGRNWAAFGGGSRVSAARLFGRSVARFRLETSPLGGAPLRSYGNPDDDPFTALSYRIQLSLPPVPGRPTPDPADVARLVSDNAPAHLVAQIRPGRSGFVVGTAMVEVDTAFVSPPPAVLGSPSGDGAIAARLSRDCVLRAGRLGSPYGVQVDRSVVALDTVAL